MQRPATHTLLLIQTASTLSMCGLIWFVQIVHYPLFAEVGVAGFARYEAMHATRTGWVVGPLMVAELVTAMLLLLPFLRPPAISPAAAGLGAAMTLPPRTGWCRQTGSGPSPGPCAVYWC